MKRTNSCQHIEKQSFEQSNPLDLSIPDARTSRIFKHSIKDLEQIRAKNPYSNVPHQIVLSILRDVENMTEAEQEECFHDLDVMNGLIHYLDDSDEYDPEEIDEIFEYVNAPNSGMTLNMFSIELEQN